MIVGSIEKFDDIFPDIQELLPQHYAELASNQDKVPLSPQYFAYQKREAEGSLIVATLRDDGLLLGYFVGFIAPGLHYSTCLTCTMDIFYIRPDRRNGTLGVRLFRYVEAELKKRNVQRWYMGSKLNKDASALFERIGAEPVEKYYSKWIGG